MAIIRDIYKTNHKKNATVYHCALLLSIPAEAKDKILWYFYKSFLLTETADIAAEITIRSASYTRSVTWRIKKGRSFIYIGGASWISPWIRTIFLSLIQMERRVIIQHVQLLFQFPILYLSIPFLGDCLCIIGWLPSGFLFCKVMGACSI